METSHTISVGNALLWVCRYFCVMLFYTAINLGVWRKINTSYSGLLNLGTMIFLSVAFVWLLTEKTQYGINIFDNMTWVGFVIAILCAILFFFLLDKCLDPFFKNLFPSSEKAYQDSLLMLSKAPIITFIHVSILAPAIEEILMRGFVLGGLQNSVGIVAALLISSALFALLHFNMVQTLSAFICGLILGLLYLKTGSLLCCMIAHCGYNMISYFVTIAPLTGK